jgi:hypothetical protein
MQNQTINYAEVIQQTKQFLAYLQSLLLGHIYQVSENEVHSGKDYRGIFANPGEVIKQFSGEILLGYYTYGCPVGDGYGETDVRQYRYLISQALSELLKGHIRLVGPSRAGKSEFLFKLVVNLAKNQNFSIVWFSTKWQEDKEFFTALFPKHTVISANDIHLTRLTQGRFNPLDRISVVSDRVNIQDCRKLAETLINLIPIENISGDTEKFMRDVVVRLAGILELFKYYYGSQATLAQILPLWVILPQGDKTRHPLEALIESKQVPAEAKQRLRRILLPLLQRQPAHEIAVGPTAQQLLSQIESLASVLAAADIADFGLRLRNATDGQVLVIDQSDGMNSAISTGLARLIFPLLYDDLVAQCPSNWQDLGMRPVLMVVDEMNSLLGGGGEIADFLEKALSKGVLMAFGQQSSAGNTDPRLNAAMSNNTRLQVLFSGCDASDPLVQDMNAVAGRYSAPLEPHRSEEGFAQLERLPVDAIANLGVFNCLMRVKSITNCDRIMLVNQGNSLIPQRQNILNLRFSLALVIYSGQVDDETQRELQVLYRQVEHFLLLSYGYWSNDELAAGYESLNLSAIAQAYNQVMRSQMSDAQTLRENMRLENSRPEFARSEAFNLSKNLVQWQHEQAKSIEIWLWSSFLEEMLPEIQSHQPIWGDKPLKKPRVEWWKGSGLGKSRFLFWEFGEDFSTRAGKYWQAVLSEYQIYAEAFGKENPALWSNGVGTLVAWRVGKSGSYHRNLGALGRSLKRKK